MPLTSSLQSFQPERQQRAECTKPLHLQSLANFVAKIHSQGITVARTKMLPFHWENHSIVLANSLAALNSQLVV